MNKTSNIINSLLAFYRSPQKKNSKASVGDFYQKNHHPLFPPSPLLSSTTSCQLLSEDNKPYEESSAYCLYDLDYFGLMSKSQLNLKHNYLILWCHRLPLRIEHGLLFYLFFQVLLSTFGILKTKTVAKWIIQLLARVPLLLCIPNFIPQYFPEFIKAARCSCLLPQPDLDSHPVHNCCYFSFDDSSNDYGKHWVSWHILRFPHFLFLGKECPWSNLRRFYDAYVHFQPLHHLQFYSPKWGQTL